MSTYQILCLIGVSGLFGSLWAYLISKIKMLKAELDALKAGTQAVLRNNLIELYDKYNAIGSTPTYIKDNFENLYKQYHTLGANGVMDSYYQRFIDLPTEREV